MLKFRGLDGRHAVLRVALLLLLVPATAMCADTPRAFDLPVQPLDQALERFSIETGWSLMYVGGLTDGMHSRPVHGMLEPQVALQQLLAGSGLELQITAPERVILRQGPAPVAAPSTAAVLDEASARKEFAGLQRQLADAFCDDPLLRPGHYDARLEFTIEADGGLTALQLHAATGSPTIDQRLRQALSTLRVAPSAAALQQPVVLHILRQRSPRDCGGVRSIP